MNKINPAQLGMALSFKEQLHLGANYGTGMGMPGGATPPGVEYLDDGRVRLNFYAPTAEKVALGGMTGETLLEKQDNGVWTLVLDDPRPGLSPLFFTVDGVSVINPMAPIGFGASRPGNMLEVPQEGVDFFYCKDVPHGAVSQEFYFAETTGEWESCYVYTPPGYMNGTESYPVIYLQHGHGENERCWTTQGKVNFIMDNLIAEGKAKPCIIVMNNGMVQSDEPEGRRVRPHLLEDLLVRDCIPYIDRTYRTLTDRENRAMAGLSMGSMQTSIITLKHPELFAYAGVFSGFIHAIGWLGVDSDEHLEAMNDVEKFTRDYKVFFRAMGSEDNFRKMFVEDSAFMAEKGLSPDKCASHIEVTYPGAHDWNVWRMCIRDFAQLIFK